ncbi:hypothetical protein TNIN_248632 [Trichonephila inaurata madagascariensis]|uniref:non-specific serine/threonine protein kinase n=1 Tax=Trichonephila inaurata madagascariensis TaxID=2747483 RepID=A0A8X7BXM8_9ARAC|nr:hypothetical protein TNIN_248632 [Trichonephila inaurata madagascariensis]
MENYEKIRLIGRGAFGTVYLCKQKSDSKLVITKEIPVDQMTVEERQVSMNEAKVLAMLDHPNVVAYFESFLEDKTMIIVMEYVQGGTLFDYLIQRKGKLMSEEVVGTPCYISPELCEGKPYNQKSDIWALGCILYELMTLKRPFDASTLPALIMKIMKGSFEPVEGIYSLELRKLLLSMLHLDHNQRPTAAQIMCHPVMIKTIFKLYVDIGSIPCNRRIMSVKVKNSKQGSSYAKSESNDTLCENTTVKGKMFPSILLFDNKASHFVVLPNPPRAIIKSISLGSEDRIGITESGVLISWKIKPGISINTNEKNVEHQIPSFIPCIVDEKIAINIVSVVCGDNFTVCLSDNGVVFTFGKASSGCLGTTSDRDVNQPRIVEALFNHDIKSIACGPKHVLAVTEENDVFAWGHGSSGSLGLGDVTFQVLPQLVQIQCKDPPEKVYCGADCSFLITKDMSLLVCGSNRHNKIGMDSSEGSLIDEIRVFTPLQLDALHITKVVSVSSGKSHTVIMDDFGELYSMGSNRFGQLGWGKPVVTHDKELYCWGKCPVSLMDKEETNICDMRRPNCLKGKHVQFVSCYDDSCIAVVEN